MIYWLCPKPAAPSGGVAYIHLFAKLMDEHGYFDQVKVIQTEPFVVDWTTERIPGKLTAFASDVTEEDVLVIPECLLPIGYPARLVNLNCKKLIAVQNHIWIPKGMELKDKDVFVVSRYLANHLSREYSAKVLGIVHPYLVDGFWDEHTFDRVQNTAVIFSRRTHMAKPMAEALKAAGFYVTVESGPVNQYQIRDLLQRHQFYIHLQSPEGWPQLVLEAYRAGALVIGTTGGGGNEFMFDRESALVVPDPLLGHCSEDVFIAEVVDRAIAARNSPELRERLTKTAYDWSLRYTKEDTALALMELFQQFV